MMPNADAIREQLRNELSKESYNSPNYIKILGKMKALNDGQVVRYDKKKWIEVDGK